MLGRTAHSSVIPVASDISAATSVADHGWYEVKNGWFLDTHEALASWTTNRARSTFNSSSNALQAGLLYSFDSY
ncbi:uncharacterized protein Asalp_34260 [Aeromonas salmonicida subsp. pectinolytica 34mel]|uniref:Uncharacterized protein n=1 Tax=Aeromonas salmonicida subsp. pectinolytica 34mel TaxID=1324960 RepID=A0A2D1QJY0_AERSA|nr:hypothetical protein O23A_p0433 [Aeromonas salmonicida]ATP10523.1 uncharacterized protein Asalp_34260 [Aeromonas salmonicida subsp. pectinolytica 34mel]